MLSDYKLLSRFLFLIDYAILQVRALGVLNFNSAKFSDEIKTMERTVGDCLFINPPIIYELLN